MVAILHCVITEIENYRIKNNIQKWRMNTKIDNIIDGHRDQVDWIKEQVRDYEDIGDDPHIKELKLKVWNVCGDGNQISSLNIHHIDKQVWYKEIKIKISSSFIFAALGFINSATFELEIENYQVGEVSNPEDLKKIIVFLMMKLKHSINELKNELLEIEEKIEAEINEIIN